MLAGTLAPAQDPKDGDWQETPGFALVKPQAWSQNSETLTVEFRAVIDRTVKGGPLAGYYVLRTAKTPDMQVPTARVVRLVIYPVNPSQIIRPAQRAALQQTIEENKALCTQFPQLEKPLAALIADAKKYDLGNVKDAGQWIGKSAYYKKKAAVLAGLAKTEIREAKKVREVNLSMNQYYTGLQIMAEGEPSIKAQVDDVLALYQQLCRKEERNELMEKLRSANITAKESEICIGRLRALNPEEDAEVSQFIGAKEHNADTVTKVDTQVQELQTAFEKEMADKPNAAMTKLISEDLVARTHQIEEGIKSAPQSIPLHLDLAHAMAACAAALTNIQEEMDAKLFFDAKVNIVGILDSAKVVGPNTAATVDALKKKTTAILEQFETLRDEAKEFKSCGKAAEALEKYQEAFAVMPNKEVAAQIDTLK